MPVHLAAHASQDIDVAEVIAAAQPVADGNFSPRSVQQGSAEFAGLEGPTQPIHLEISAGIFNVKTATCRMPCICCPQISELDDLPSPFGTATGTSTQMHVTAHWRNGTTSDVTNSISYSSQNAAIATVQTRGSAHPGLVTGVGVGSTFLWLSTDTSGVSRACYPDSFDCDPQTIGIEPPVTVCDFTITPPSASSNDCTGKTEQKQDFEAVISPSPTMCLYSQKASGCNADASGNVTIDFSRSSCDVTVSPIATVYYFSGPKRADGTAGTINMQFTLAFDNENTVTHTQLTPVTCP